MASANGIEGDTKLITTEQYQKWLKADYLAHTHLPNFYAVGASEEVGEIMGIIKRHMRGDENYRDLYSDFVRRKMIKEVGDSLWYLLSLIVSYGWSLNDVLNANYNKLQERDKKGTRLGDGSDR